jgi:hypothetical protein
MVSSVASERDGAGPKANIDGMSRRGPLAVQAIPLVLLIPVTFILPETPRWLVLNGKDDKALRILRRLHKGAQTETFIQGEFQEIKDQIAAEQSMFEPTWIEIVKKPSWRRRVILACVLQTLAQMTGINCIQYYAGE